jgi:glucose/arabinose dehydrogenase
VAGDRCGTGGSISGMAFNTGSRYPAALEGALFFADYSRNCLWAMRRGANGAPDPSAVSVLVQGAAGPVGLQAGPDGYLYYVAIGEGTIRRLEYGEAPPPRRLRRRRPARST